MGILTYLRETIYRDSGSVETDDRYCSDGLNPGQRVTSEMERPESEDIEAVLENDF